MFDWLLYWIGKVDILVTSKVNKTREVVFVDKNVRQMSTEHIFSNIDSSVAVLCCRAIDAGLIGAIVILVVVVVYTGYVSMMTAS